MKKLTIILIMLLITLSACANNSVALLGEWKLIAYGDSTNPTLALPNVETSINFETDGQFGGSVGCNTFGGEYKVNGSEIVFSDIFSTLMFCEGISEQETMVLNIFSNQTLNAEMNGDQLTLTSADGSSVIVLERK